MQLRGTDPLTELPVAGLAAEAEPPFFQTSRQFFALLVGYFALHVIIRTLLSSSVDLDESEQLVMTQRLSWGYGSSPPLYSWLQAAVFSVFGRSVFSLALFKNLLLLSTYSLTYWNARLITRTHACGVAAALSLLFIPDVAWESQRDLTHSVLASTLTAGTLTVFLLTHQRRHIAGYLLLGLWCGLALLSKYNCAFWLAGLFLAALSLPEFRPTLLDKRIVPALCLCLAVVLPHAFWLSTHRQLAVQDASRFHLQPSGEWLTTVAKGITYMLVAAALSIAPLVLIFLAMLFKSHRMDRVCLATRSCARLIARGVLIVLFLAGMGVLTFRATEFRERWFQPLLICAPVLAVTFLRNRLDSSRLKLLACLSLFIMLCVALVIPSRILFGARLHREEPLMRPYRALARQLRPVADPAPVIVAEDCLVGGNLSLVFPQKTIVTIESVDLFNLHPTQCLVVWDARHQSAPPGSLTHWASRYASADLSRFQPQFVSAPYLFHQNRAMRLGFAQIE